MQLINLSELKPQTRGESLRPCEAGSTPSGSTLPQGRPVAQRPAFARHRRAGSGAGVGGEASPQCGALVMTGVWAHTIGWCYDTKLPTWQSDVLFCCWRDGDDRIGVLFHSSEPSSEPFSFRNCDRDEMIFRWPGEAERSCRPEVGDSSLRWNTWPTAVLEQTPDVPTELPTTFWTFFL